MKEKKDKYILWFKDIIYRDFNLNPEGKPSVSYGARNIENLQETGKAARESVMKGEIPKDLKREIINGYKKLGKKYGQNPTVAVRTSGVAEETATASFAGPFET